jgi:hypothetical protein
MWARAARYSQLIWAGNGDVLGPAVYVLEPLHLAMVIFAAAVNIRNAGARLAAYVRIRDDSDSERRFAEIRLRAIRKIGELSRELDKAQAGRPPKEILPSDGNNLTKAETLAQAGISTSTAYRYEELAGPREEQTHQAANAAADQ